MQVNSASKPDRINLVGRDHEIISVRDNIRVEDCFVQNNKIGKGHGEKRLYVGSQRDNNIDKFFNSFKSNSTSKYFFLKSDFKSYLDDAQSEYKNPTQPYKNDITITQWNEYNSDLNGFSEEIGVNLEKALGDEDVNRYYVRAEDHAWSFMRRVALPNYSSISIMKLRVPNQDFSYFHLRLFLDNEFREDGHLLKWADVGIC